MKFITICSSIFIVSLLFEAVSYSTDTEENLPRIAFVKNEGANVRAGDNINFESLCILEKNDPVRIIGQRYSWFKIVLPKKVHLYIKNDYVDISTEEGVGIVNAESVNLRTCPDLKHPILGRVSKTDKLNIISEKDGWYEVEPPEQAAGWVHSSQISFSFE